MPIRLPAFPISAAGSAHGYPIFFFSHSGFPPGGSFCGWSGQSGQVTDGFHDCFCFRKNLNRPGLGTKSSRMPGSSFCWFPVPASNICACTTPQPGCPVFPGVSSAKLSARQPGIISGLPAARFCSSCCAPWVSAFFSRCPGFSLSNASVPSSKAFTFSANGFIPPGKTVKSDRLRQ